MTNQFFPDLNLAYDYVKKPYYETKIAVSVNGRELRASLQSQPKYELTLALPVMSQRNSDIELDTLENFFHRMKGSFQSFLLKVMDDNVYNYTIIGDDTKSVYNIIKGDLILSNVKAITGGSVSPFMWNTADSTLMWNTLNSTKMWYDELSYTISEKGIITFNRNLKLGETVIIPVEYYYRCRFSEDSQQLTLFTHKLWKGEVNLIASLGAHI